VSDKYLYCVGKVVLDRVGSIDVMLTTLELAELNVPEKARKQLRGASLVPAMRGEAVTRDIFSETD